MENHLPLPLPPKTLGKLTDNAKDWAIIHGIGYRTPEHPNASDIIGHAPIALLPSPIPRDLFNQACLVQTDFNLLYHRVAHDHEFLKKSLECVIKVDDFTKGLWDIYEAVRKEGIAQPLCLGLHRNDFIVQKAMGNKMALKQIEFNTMAAGLGALGKRLTEYHRYALHLINHANLTVNIPDNNCIEGLTDGMAEAWKIYGQKEAAILFLVEPIEKNICDQRWHEFYLYDVHKVKVIRKHLLQVYESSQLTEDKRLFVDGVEIAVVYFRAGFSPKHYPTEKHWEARLQIEHSTAIKSPNIQYHLAGTKKIQQELFKEGVVEKYIDNPKAVARIRETFAALHSLDPGQEGDENVALVKSNPEKFVLKPQREGGGNNVYGEDILQVLNGMSNEERGAYILMERLFPVRFRNYPLRPFHPVQLEDMVSELGVFGCFLGTENDIIKNIQCGHLVRTKVASFDEGGLCAGVGVIDSPYLV